MHVQGQNHRSTSLAPVDAQEAGGYFHAIQALGLFQVIREGQSIGTFASRHQTSRQEACQYYLWKLFGWWESVKRENFQECQRAGIHTPCLSIAWYITPFKCEIYNMIMLLEKKYVQEEYFCFAIILFLWVMVLVLVYKRPLLWSILTLSLWGYSCV